MLNFFILLVNVKIKAKRQHSSGEYEYGHQTSGRHLRSVFGDAIGQLLDEGGGVELPMMMKVAAILFRVICSSMSCKRREAIEN